MSLRFKKKVEDFACENCGHAMKGDGYTNHCSSCFYSKHVDINPGDRAEDCGGLMKPIAVREKSGGYSVIQKCLRCDRTKQNKLHKNDDLEALLSVLQ